MDIKVNESKFICEYFFVYTILKNVASSNKVDTLS